MRHDRNDHSGSPRAIKYLLEILIEAYRDAGDPDAEEMIDCCIRAAIDIASEEGEQAAVEWLEWQVPPVRIKSQV